MPFFRYRCAFCGKEFEELVANHTVKPPCPFCGKEGERIWGGQVFASPCAKSRNCGGDCSRCKGCK